MAEQMDDIHTGDLAEAWNVQRLIDLIKGIFGFPVKLIAHRGDQATLTLRNLQAGAPVLEIFGSTGVDPLFRIADDGLEAAKFSKWIDWVYQSSTVPAPGAGTGLLRMYARGGQLFFKAEGSAEQQIPVGQPPGPSLRYGFWQRQ